MVAFQHSRTESGPQIGRILLVDGDPFLLHSLSACLRRNGFPVSATASTADALGLAVTQRPALVLIGLTDPADRDETCRKLRALSEAPIYILTDHLQPHGDPEQPAGVAGVHLAPASDEADLIARIHAALRQTNTPGAAGDEDLLTVGALQICPCARTVTKLGQTIDLSPIEFRLLTALARESGKTVPDRRLLAEVWGPDYAEDAQNLRIFIRYLRAKIEDDPNDPRYILTDWGAGYRLAGPEQ
jgi:two-component system KDP operon response regulator KdpE